MRKACPTGTAAVSRAGSGLALEARRRSHAGVADICGVGDRFYSDAAPDSICTAGVFIGTGPVLRRMRALLLDRGLFGLPGAGAGDRPFRMLWGDPFTGASLALSVACPSMRYGSRFFTPAIPGGGFPRPVQVFPVFGSRYFATPIVVLVFLLFFAFGTGAALTALGPNPRSAAVKA